MIKGLFYLIMIIFFILDNFSTLRSTKSDMTGILQHNYSNIQTGHSFHSGNLSQVGFYLHIQTVHSSHSGNLSQVGFYSTIQTGHSFHSENLSQVGFLSILYNHIV